MENDHLPRSVLWQGTEVWLSSQALEAEAGAHNIGSTLSYLHDSEQIT